MHESLTLTNPTVEHLCGTAVHFSIHFKQGGVVQVELAGFTLVVGAVKKVTQDTAVKETLWPSTHYVSLQ